MKSFTRKKEENDTMVFSSRSELVILLSSQFNIEMIQMVMIMAGARKKNTYESHNGLSQLIMNSNTKKMGQ
ncbi:hypothetical protein DERF_008587 [Dermatophagoides farinae]|uniref:Uncharacterized protein n=1 Tax=Dermatophagoides farinae TaxID=6954 RepID=A0A922I4T0_DERFA|nr:hypothetical protein DERF_008587 [Dermatophagoides farinae]